MTFLSKREFGSARAKLWLFEACDTEWRPERDGPDDLPDASTGSLVRLINRPKEEIACYRARRAAAQRQ